MPTFLTKHRANSIRNKMSRSEKLTSKVAAVSSKLAGGGVTKYADPSKFEIDKFEAPVVDGLKEAYKQCHVKDQSFEDYLRLMASDESNAVGLPQEQELSHPLSNYFISSSHNVRQIMIKPTVLCTVHSSFIGSGEDDAF
jgi:hypothetical protein